MIIPRSLLLLLVLFTSCKTASLVTILRKGSYEAEKEVVEIAYEKNAEIIIIPVSIGDRTFRFMFDTGAPNVVSPEVASFIQSKTKTTQKVNDSSDKSQNLDFIEIPLIKIGEASFKNTGAAVTDFTKASILRCFDVDGIIGSNLMQTCVVQIDYLDEIIRFSKDIHTLTLQDGFEIPFTTSIQGTPYIKFGVASNTITQLMIDTGYNGFLKLDQESKKKILPHLTNSPTYRVVGTASEGIFGASGIDTTSNHWFSNFKMDTVATSVAGSLTFQNTKSKLMGNEYLKNYITTFDWKRKMVHFSPLFLTKVMPQGYEVGFQRVDDKLQFSWIKLNSKSHELGIRLEDQVLGLEHLDTRVCTPEVYCDVIDLLKEKRNQITLHVLLNGQEKTITLQRKDLF